MDNLLNSNFKDDSFTISECRELICEIVKSLRGDRSQMDLSDQLGYPYNQLYRWESGKVSLYWEDFVRLCSVSDVDLLKVLHKIKILPNDLSPERVIAEVFGCMDRDFVCRSLEFSKMTYNNLISGKKHLTVDQFIMGIGKLHYVLSDFLTYLSCDFQHENFEAQHEDNYFAKEYLVNNSRARMIQTLLDLDTYKSSPDGGVKQISDMTGYSLEEVERELMKLEELELIRQDGNHYRIADDFPTFAGNSKLLRQYFLSEAMFAYDRIHSSQDEQMQREFNSNILLVNEAMQAKIRKMAIEFYNGAFSVISDDKLIEQGPRNQLYHIQCNLFKLLK